MARPDLLHAALPSVQAEAEVPMVAAPMAEGMTGRRLQQVRGGLGGSTAHGCLPAHP